MVKKILSLMLLLLPLAAFAQDALQVRGNDLIIVSPALTPGDVKIGAANGLLFPLAGTQPKFPVASIITPSTSYPTPNAGDSVSNRLNIVATAAPTAVFVEIPKATPNVGETFTLINRGASPALMVPITGDSVNALAAGTPYSCATTKVCDCTVVENGVHSCTSR